MFENQYNKAADFQFNDIVANDALKLCSSIKKREKQTVLRTEFKIVRFMKNKIAFCSEITGLFYMGYISPGKHGKYIVNFLQIVPYFHS